MGRKKALPPPPKVRYVDVDLTDNFPEPPSDAFMRLEGRALPVYVAPDGRVVLVPRGPTRVPSEWGTL